MSFPLESGCKSRGFECNSQIYWKVFFIILKQFCWIYWLSVMLDNIFFTCTRKPEGVWHLYYIYNTLWRAAYHLKKSEKKEKQHEKKGKLAGKNGKDNWKYRERNRETPARLQKSKGPGTANFRKKFRNKRKTILKMRKRLKEGNPKMHQAEGERLENGRTEGVFLPKPPNKWR